MASLSAVISSSAAIPVHGFWSRFAGKWSYRITLFSANFAAIFTFFFPASVSGFESASASVLSVLLSDPEIFDAPNRAKHVER